MVIPFYVGFRKNPKNLHALAWWLVFAWQLKPNGTMEQTSKNQLFKIADRTVDGRIPAITTWDGAKTL